MSSELGFNSPDHLILPEPEIPFDLIDRELKLRTSNDPAISRESDVLIVDINDFLGRGGYSDWVRKAEVSTIDPEGEKSPAHTFVIKHYKSEYKDDLKKSLDNFEALKRAGLKTWTTYRINTDEDIALMTYGNFDQKIMLSNNNEATTDLAKNLELKKLKIVDNLLDLTKKLIEQAKIAADAGIYIPNDGFGFILPEAADKDEHAEIDFILSDLDGFIYKDKKDPLLLEDNLNNTRNGLFLFLSRYVEEDFNLTSGLADISRAFKEASSNTQ